MDRCQSYRKNAMTYPDAMSMNRGRQLSPAIVLTVAAYSVLTVYGICVSLHSIDADTGTVAATESLKVYREAVAGLRDFPYQWRLLGVYLVYGIERVTGFDPHAIDIAVKSMLLSVSSTMLFLFSRFDTSVAGALCAVGFYLLLTLVGFIDQYSIYYTNDFVMIACWFGAVYFIRTEQYVAAASLAFVGAWAKETMLLAPVLIGLRWLRGRTSVTTVALAAAAFLLPTVVLRWLYRAPITEWAWWHMLFSNVPFLQTNMQDLAVTLKNNVKVALFFNLFRILAARAALRTPEPFVKDLALTAVVYLLITYPVIYIRELRHFLPLAILVLPLAIAEIEQRAASSAAPAHRARPDAPCSNLPVATEAGRSVQYR